MVAVATSGVFGRYLYLQIPRNIFGDELSNNELVEISNEMANHIKKEFKLDDELLRQVEEYTAPKMDQDAGILSILFLMFISDISHYLGWRKMPEQLAANLNLSPRLRQIILREARKKALLQRRMVLANQIHQLFHYWHVIHKPFAFIMYLIMIVHIAVDVWTGYSWIF
jgi:hypothetical protein